jgi:hypothetical protein
MGARTRPAFTEDCPRETAVDLSDSAASSPTFPNQRILTTGVYAFITVSYD